MNKKIVIYVFLVLIIVAGAYFTGKRSANNPLQLTTPESTKQDIIANLKNNWVTVQTLIPFKPDYHNQEENLKKIWRTPIKVEYISNDKVAVYFEDDNNPHIAIFAFENNTFTLIEVFKNQGNLSDQDRQKIVK